MRALRLVLAVAVAVFVLRAVPAHSSHGDVPIHALAIDPLTPTTLYAGTPGSVVKSTDGGANWSATGLTNISGVSVLAIDPLTPTTLYAGTPGGVVKSTDGGASWNATGLTRGALSLAIDPLAPTTLYAGTDGAVYKSTDAGASWNATGGLAGEVSSLAIDPLTPTTLYAGTFVWGLYYYYGASSGGVYKSTDGGASWSPAVLIDPFALGSGSIGFSCGPCGGVLALAIDPLIPTALFAGTDAFVEYDYWGNVIWTAPGLVIGSTDGGTSWPVSAVFGSDDSIPTLAIQPRTDPLTPSTLYAGTYDVFKSTDGGASWSATGLTAGGRTLAIDPLTPTTLYAGTFASGVFKSTDGGANWNPTGLITWLHTSSVSLNPTSVIGGNPSTGTVTLSASAPAGGAVVVLYSGKAVALVPASVTVPAGATSADFTISTSPVPVGASTAVMISGSYGGVSSSAMLTVTSATTLSSLSLNPTSVIGGAASIGTVTLSAAAPAGGAEISLSSSNPAVATVPASVTVPAGATWSDFTVSTSSVTASTSVTIWAANYSAVLTVTPVPLSSLSLNPTSVTGGAASIGTVTLGAAAPAGGVVVELASSNTAVATVPASVTVAAGATSATFTVSTAACASGTVTISGAYAGVTRSAVLTVTPATTDTVAIQIADYLTGRQRLRVVATSTSTVATLQVFVTASGTLIGALTKNNDVGGRYSGQFTWPVNPQNITVRSSLCGSATKAVKAVGD